MANKKGTCRNDMCEMNGKVQEVDEFDFVCPSCHKELFPLDTETRSHGFPKILIILIVVLVLVGAGVGIWLYLPVLTKHFSKVPTPAAEVAGPAEAQDTVAGRDVFRLSFAPESIVSRMSVGETEVLKVTVQPADHEEELVWTSSNEDVLVVSGDGTVTAVAVGNAVIVVESSRSHKKLEQAIAVSPSQRNGVLDLGYGVYTGDSRNGKPHGYGKITYKERHKIVNSKDFIASPGDTFEGDFRDGRISGLGYWKHNGHETVVKP